METDKSPTERVSELAALVTKIQLAGAGELYYDGWDQRASAAAPPEERATMTAGLAEATSLRSEATAALAALAAEIRVETPAATAAWADALTAIPGRTGMDLVAAVLDFPGINGRIAIPALEQALGDEDGEVRKSAWDGLVKVFDLGRHLQNPDGKRDMSTEVELLRVLLDSDLTAFVKMGTSEMRQLSGQLQAGATPEALGIAWTPSAAPGLFDKLRLALYDLEAQFPVEELAQLTGADRRWAEAMIAFRLPAQDLRAPAALAKLGAKWTAPALAEVARSTGTSPELNEQITQSLRTLNG